MNKIELKLIDTYQQMANYTLPECKNTCKNPLSCCSPEYCELAIDQAKEYWNINLQLSDLFKEGKTNLPLMGNNGCTAAPHLRISCTLHTCEINSLGFKLTDKNWTDEYYRLRDMINDLEYERYVDHQITEFLKSHPNYKEINYSNDKLSAVNDDNIETIVPNVMDIDEALTNLR